jgi:class 3 adenylate cyclase
MAARLQGQSAGDDIVLSHAVATDPAVQEILAHVPQRQETVALKGFAAPVGFLRLLSSRETDDKATSA